MNSPEIKLFQTIMSGSVDNVIKVITHFKFKEIVNIKSVNKQANNETLNRRSMQEIYNKI